MKDSLYNTYSVLKRITAFLLVVALCFGLVACTKEKSPDPTVVTTTTPTEPTTEPTTVPPETTQPTIETTVATEPTEPYIVSNASVGVSGDLLIHAPIINNALTASGEYDFAYAFEYAAPYFQQFDYMVANLEVTLAGPTVEYSGYPKFNCPDSMVDALLDAGVDMLLTANNHSYDTRYDGFIRTQQVLNEKGMDHIGTRLSIDDPVYSIQDINGIQVGMVCYTYDTTSQSNGRKSLNGIVLSEEARPLVNSFDYKNLDPFYEEVEGVLEQMRNDGAEAIIFYIHWGYEYTTRPISYQKNIAQKLCDLGVDVIVGGHPHVLEPFETITSENGNQTYCLYSTGNLISCQRRTTLETVKDPEYTEDGIIFGVTFQKWNDGTVEICEVSATPTWVSRDTAGSKRIYRVIPLDITLENWEDAYDISGIRYLDGSYERTMSIIGKGINEAREALGLEPYPLKLD